MTDAKVEGSGQLLSGSEFLRQFDRSSRVPDNQICFDRVLVSSGMRLFSEFFQRLKKYLCELLPGETQGSQRRMEDIAKVDIVKPDH